MAASKCKADQVTPQLKWLPTAQQWTQTRLLQRPKALQSLAPEDGSPLLLTELQPQRPSSGPLPAGSSSRPATLPPSGLRNLPARPLLPSDPVAPGTPSLQPLLWLPLHMGQLESLITGHLSLWTVHAMRAGSSLPGCRCPPNIQKLLKDGEMRCYGCLPWPGLFFQGSWVWDPHQSIHITANQTKTPSQGPVSLLFLACFACGLFWGVLRGSG